MPGGLEIGVLPCNLAALSQTGHSPARSGAGRGRDRSLYGDPQAGKKMALFRGLTAVLAAGALGAFVGQSLAAQAGATALPSQLDLAHNTPSGNYLAARTANVDRDAATAAAYYTAALKADPKNPELLELAFYAHLASGEVDEAAKLAARLLAIDKTNRNARLILGVHALKNKQYAAARAQFAQAGRDPIANLTSTLLSAWSSYGSGDAKTALDTVDKLSGPDWFGVFKDLHGGLIADLSRAKKDAQKRFERAYKADQTALRIVQSYGSFTARSGAKPDALKIYQEFDKTLPRHPLITQAVAQINKGEKVPQIVDSAQAGAAEVLYGLGAALGRREEELSLANRGLAYLQLAIYLDPNHTLAILALADPYDAMRKPDLAIPTDRL